MRKSAHKSTYKKLVVQWLKEAFLLWQDTLCFASSFVVAEIFVLRNRQLLVALKLQRALYSDTIQV